VQACRGIGLWPRRIFARRPSQPIGTGIDPRAHYARPESALVTEDCHAQCHSLMATMNVSLPDELKSFVDQQVAAHGYASTSEYLRNLIRKQRDIE
jgi:hypothetical protein